MKKLFKIRQGRKNEEEEEIDGNSSDFSNLAFDCIGHIFSFIADSTSFFRLLSMSKNTKSWIENEIFQNFRNVKFCLSVFQDFYPNMKEKKYIQKLEITECIMIRDFDFLQHLHELRDLSVYGQKFFFDDTLADFVLSNPKNHLEKLRFVSCERLRFSFFALKKRRARQSSEEIPVAFFKKLKTLMLDECRSIERNVIPDFFENLERFTIYGCPIYTLWFDMMKNLKHLTIDSVDHLHFEEDGSFKRKEDHNTMKYQNLEKILYEKLGHNLESLRLLGCKALINYHYSHANSILVEDTDDFFRGEYFVHHLMNFETIKKITITQSPNFTLENLHDDMKRKKVSEVLFPSLEEFSFSFCPNLEPKILEYLTRSPNLEKMEISHCDKITDNNEAFFKYFRCHENPDCLAGRFRKFHITTNQAEKKSWNGNGLVQWGKNLEVLVVVIDKSLIFFGGEEENGNKKKEEGDEDWKFGLLDEDVFSNVPNLRVLKVRNNGNIRTDNFVRKLVSLKKISLRRFKNLECLSFEYESCCRDLEILELHEMESLRRINISKLRRLSRLTINECQKLQNITECITQVGCQLDLLKVSGNEFLEDSVLLSLGERLLDLILMDCPNISFSSLVSESKGEMGLVNLRNLRIHEMEGVQDSMIRKLDLPNLEKIRVSNCSNICGSSFQNFPRLIRLYVNNCPNMKGLHKVQQVRFLSIVNCDISWLRLKKMPNLIDFFALGGKISRDKLLEGNKSEVKVTIV